MAINEQVIKSERLLHSSAEEATSTELSLSGQNPQRVYQELPGKNLVETDVIEQLHANILQLEDLHLRMKFMLAEIKGLVQKP